MNMTIPTREEFRKLLQDPKFVAAMIEEYKALHQSDQPYYDDVPSDEDLLKLFLLFADNPVLCREDNSE